MFAVQWHRQMAAGDQLRVVYDQLSRDPASLSNLDQDLPNYAQHQVPIFSLPQVLNPLSPANALHISVSMCHPVRSTIRKAPHLPKLIADAYLQGWYLLITFLKWNIC